MKEKEKSQEEKNREIARKQWDSWIVDLEEKEEEQEFNEYGDSEDCNGDS